MEFWPIFDIFHGLRPYLCSKRAYLGFHKQATHRRRGDEPFFYSGVDRSWLGMAQKWSILDQKWPNIAGSSTTQSDPKGSKRDHFKLKLIFCPEASPPNPKLSMWGKMFIFIWNGPIGSRWAQNGPKWSKTFRFTILVPFGPLWNVVWCLVLHSSLNDLFSAYGGSSKLRPQETNVYKDCSIICSPIAHFQGWHTVDTRQILR